MAKVPSEETSILFLYITTAVLRLSYFSLHYSITMMEMTLSDDSFGVFTTVNDFGADFALSFGFGAEFDAGFGTFNGSAIVEVEDASLGNRRHPRRRK